MSYLIYLSLQGDKQGLISTGCSSKDSIGNRYQLGHENEIQVIGLNHSMTRTQNSSHHPIQILKPIDKSSPLLGVALNNNELFSAVFYFYRTSGQGGLEKFYELKLTKASLVEVSCVYPNSINNNELMPYEKLLMKYESISWRHLMSGTEGYSISNDNVF
ncbi:MULTISPECIES: Hcp family type VI secretion system effector [Providencia]|uniref:Hcp family type VI secretion system effector n=1 Tax=Providencia rettgeri TaxID=587 RepID=A0AAE3CXS8_PRORE|nr:MULTISPECIES: Hcp family type VI secretion system effector [Providencia]MBG5928587.1 Hcp family type VI secretion system effector [Providencia rettgeri]MBW3118933.1 Hcp family type VI secretion system effector [Providencia rettgeri]NHN52258.1 Hcp family type VI secretion system effector [Providencia rettgeri]PYZ60463.1 type VI secretion system tube protein Hcp [Providencia rettgeri]QIF64956.1 Hcp family type VI secretion system effector [Providencia sp. 1709051003]